MKVVGLLSGGKDSVYNLLHCIVNGHELVALASLGPPEGKDELDSYMYQTVGHSGLASIASALDLPLFVHTIRGKAVEMGGEYGDREGSAGDGKAKKGGGTKGDETEDLYELLMKVKTAMPDIQGVSCGAILSNYQRVRVEHICGRLGLTPIAYLWERDQRELLGEMVDAGMESLLVKVAGAGLQVDHLGKSLKEMQATLHRLNAKYQLHICGEGGEYETFTVDCPLFRQRVVLDQTTTHISDSSPFSTVAHLHLDTCYLASKADHPTSESFAETRERLREVVRLPSLLDRKSERVLKAARGGWGEEEEREMEVRELRSALPMEEREGKTAGPTSSRQGDWLYFGEVLATCSTSDEVSIEEEVRSAFSSLISLFASHQTTLLSLSHLSIYLSPSSMSLFPLINAVYSTYFGSSPPTRACVSIDSLPAGRRLKLEGVAALNTEGGRTCLHVQSLSYWAPANIGPYSQGIVALHQRLFIAGQIPLLPSSLTLPSPSDFPLPSPSDFPLEVALSLQHVRRAKVAATEGRWMGWAEGGVCWLGRTKGEGEWRRKLRTAEKGWRAFERALDLTEEEEEDGDGDEGAEEERTGAPILFVEAAELPRGASVEWQVTFATGLRDASEVEDGDSDDEGEGQRVRRAETWASEVSNNGATSFQCSKSEGISKTVIAILACNINEPTRHPLPSLGAIHCIKAFHLPHIPLSTIRQVASTTLGVLVDELPALSTVGVGRIATSAEREDELAFVMTAEVQQL